MGIAEPPSRDWTREMKAAQIIPMAFVMIAGPQILSAIFLATTDNWRRNSLAYVAGAGLSITLIVSIAYLLGGTGSSGGSSSDTVYYIVLALLVMAAVQTFRGRKESKPPKWMGKLQNATPGMAFKLGALLLGIFPTDILTSFAVGSFLANGDDPWWHLLPFLATTLFLLALPSLMVFAFGTRAQAFLPKARDWMNDNSWVVSEIVIVFFILITASSIG